MTFVDIAGIVRGRLGGGGPGQQVPGRHPRERRHLPGGAGLRGPRRHPRRRPGRPGRRHRDHQHRADPGRPPDRRQRLTKLAEEARKQPDAGPAARGGRAGPRRSSTTGRTVLERGRAGEIDVDAPARPAPADAPSRSSTCSTSTRAPWATRRWRPSCGRWWRPAEAVVLCAQIEAEVAALDPDDAAELLRRLRPGRVGPGAAGPRRVPHPRPPDLPDRRAQGGAGVDDPHRRHRPGGGRRHPHRLRAGLHQGRGRQLRRPGGGRARWRRRGPPARPAWRARTT